MEVSYDGPGGPDHMNAHLAPSKPAPSAKLEIELAAKNISVFTIDCREGQVFTVIGDPKASVVTLDGYTLACFYEGPAARALGSSHGKEAQLYVDRLRERLEE